MLFSVLNSSLELIKILDVYQSLLWIDRYRECGDFEVKTGATSDVLNDVMEGYYLCNADSDHVMVVEKVLIETDVDDGNFVIFSGRSLESILDRRIVWGCRTLSGDIQTVIHTLLNENVIQPSDPSRAISNFIFSSTTDPTILGMNVDVQYIGDNLYDVICALCKEKGIGFKIVLNSSNQFEFSLYNGVNRSYDQTDNPYVIFSPKFDNLTNSSYVRSKKEYKNVALVGGEGEGAEKKFASTGSGSGLARREIYVNAGSVSSSEEDDTTLTEEEYSALLRQKGNEELAEHVETDAFEGEAETTALYKYGVDYNVGDLVQIENEFGQTGVSRITEMIFSDDVDGTSVYPTFKSMAEEDDR